MTEPRRCPQCGAEIPADAPSGLCPKCLLQAGFESQPVPAVAATQTSPAASGFVAPSLAEMAQKFPQLEILELLGKGGMGAVYKARQPGLDRLVAVKVLPPEVGQDPAFAERFTREARALARLSHPNIVAVYDFGQSSGLYYFIMEYVEGVNLRQAIRAGTISPKQTLTIVPQICDALQFAHDEGIVHRDIKPENVLIDKRGRVKIADFGLAKLMGQETVERNLTGTHQVMGTLRYMAPEQMEGSHLVDHRADIYSLGVVFYELLTGEVPMGRFAPPSQKVQIDVRLDEVVLRTLERQPEQRYQHASELKTEVEAIQHSPEAKAASVKAAQAVKQSGEMARRLALIYLVLVSLFDVALVALGSGTLIRLTNEHQAAMSGQPYLLNNDDPATEWARWLTWTFGIASLLCLAAWGYFVAQRPLTPRPRVRRYLLVAWAVIALPLAIWFAVWSENTYPEPRIRCWTLIGLMVPYVALALVWLIFGPPQEPTAAPSPKKSPGRPSYTRWVIVPMVVLFALWLAAAVGVMAIYRMGASQPNGPQQIRAWQILGLGLLALAFFVLLLLRWMQTLSSPVYWTLAKRLLLSIVCFVLSEVALIVYFFSPWNTEYLETHGLVFAPQSKAYLRLELPCHYASQSRSQAPYYSSDTFSLNIEAFYGENALHLMYVEWPGFKFRWLPENGGKQHEEPLDHQSPTGFIDHHDHFVAWWKDEVHLDLAKPEIKEEVEQLYSLLSGWDSDPPRQWDDFSSRARATLTHYDIVKEYPAKNLITLKPMGIGWFYALLLGVPAAFLLAVAAAIFAARRQRK